VSTFDAVKDPRAGLDWAFNWDDGKPDPTILVSVWEVTEGPDDALIIEFSTIADHLDDQGGLITSQSVCRVVLSGGTPRKAYTVDNRVTRSRLNPDGSNQTDSRSMRLRTPDR
jgi:hypothetical protein